MWLSASLLVGLLIAKRESRPWIVSDEPWSLIEPLLPVPAPKLVEGRPWVPDRQALCGILFVLHTGIQWEYLPQELGFGSGDDLLAMAGRLERGWRLGPAPCRTAGEAALERQAGLVAGGDRLLACAGCPQEPKSGPSPVDRARPGSKHHLIVEGQGIPLAVSLTDGNRNDVTQLLWLLDKIPAVGGRIGRPRGRPDALLADRGYDHDKYRRLLWQRGSDP